MTIACIILALSLFAGSVGRASEPAVIVPGKAIGGAKLGMTRAQYRAANANGLIHAAFAGGVVRTLFTPWGGAFATAEGVGVGAMEHTMISTYGPPRFTPGRRTGPYNGEYSEGWCAWYDPIGLGFSGFRFRRLGTVTGVWVYPKGTMAAPIPVDWDCPQH